MKKHVLSTCPVSVDPVNEKFVTKSLLMITSVTSGDLTREQGRTLKTPAGIPASSAN